MITDRKFTAWDADLEYVHTPQSQLVTCEVFVRRLRTEQHLMQQAGHMHVAYFCPCQHILSS